MVVRVDRGLVVSSFAGLSLACSPTPSSGDDEVGTSSSESSSSESDTGEGTDTSDTGELEPIVLEWDELGPELRLVRGSDVLLRFLADGFQLGEVAQVLDSSSYDPLFVEPDAWRIVSAAETIEDTPTRVEVTLIFEGGARTHLVVEELAAGRFAASWTPEPNGPALGLLRLSPQVDAQEGFYGLGEVFDRPEQRGSVRALQLEFDLALESSNNEVHVPVPFITGTRGWGMYVADDHPMVFDVAKSANDRVTATVGTGPASEAGLNFYLFGAEHPLDITGHYYAVSGSPHRPARWALGPWIWRNENDDQAQVEQDMQTLRDLDLATSAIWVDRPYASGVNSFDFEATGFPDPQAMIDQAHALGLRFALWHTPYLDPGDPSVASLRSEAELLGYFPPKTALLTSNWAEPIDFTNPDAYAWWQDKIDQYTTMGVEGFKLDYAEDVTVGLDGVRTVWAFADGSSERTMHKGYSRFYHRVYQDRLPASGGFLLARAGTHGDQVNVDVIWPGDLDATMARQGELVDGYTSVGGLPAAVVAGLSLGPSGFPLFASDTGGYRHSPPSPETFVRWFEHTALMPVMQIGTGTSDVAWDFDLQVLDWYRELTRLHLRLFPYLWTHVVRLEQDGRAIVRPLGLAYPELGIHPSFDYMLGDALLVAPVVDEGATTREIGFPPGRWIHWWTGEVIDAAEGGATMKTVAAPLGQPPLFLRAGDLVPLLRPTIDTLAPTTMPGINAGEVDSYASSAGRLTVRTSAGPSHELVLFDKTTLSRQELAGTMTLSFQPGDEFVFGAIFEVVALGSAPTSVMDQQGEVPMLDTAALAEVDRGWSFEPAELGGTLRVVIGSGNADVTIVR